ncbi:MAG: dihydroorotate dehydrogenase PyrD, partial [Ignisphaera sp.]|nr:dihydroorotate dehydrogenase PyrD [Ignisphaera sp.]
GYTCEHILRLARYGVAAIVTKTITPKARRGFDPPILVELSNGGLINAVGLENPGKGVIPELVNEAKKHSIPILVSIGGVNEQEFLEVAVAANDARADAIEINLSCPHTKGYGIEIGMDPHNVYNVVKSITSVVSIPVIAKLGLSDRVVEAAGKSLEAGARALTLINTIKSLYIDVYTLKPVLTNIFGGLSGPPIHPIAVRVVFEVYKEFKPEIIGCGGISSWVDAAEFIAAGARALQIGTALGKDPQKVINSILKGLRNWMLMHEFKYINEAVGISVKG